VQIPDICLREKNSKAEAEKEHFIHKMLNGNKIFFIKKINQIRENTLQNNVHQVE